MIDPTIGFHLSLCKIYLVFPPEIKMVGWLVVLGLTAL